ncbi:zinc ribbon domain-containing protein [Bacillus cereus]|uniref:Zinc ribbon domain-containing protein n=1 Tax=Bacillus cereus TaxID=1396 RepID=A0A2B0LHQ8_BACCE|nr:zinc ribbon domain-containing protein [Bacillus cereus]
MTCPKCNTEHTNEAKFCGNCGHALTDQATEQGEQQLTRLAPAQETISNEKVAQAKQLASGYFQFFKNALKAPSAIMKNGHIEVRNGIISLVLICFLFACLFYQMMSQAASVATRFAYEAQAPSFFGESVKIFFFLLILALFVGFIIFISGKLMKSSFSFLETVGVWGTVSTPVVAILVIALLFSFLTTFLAALFFWIAVSCMSVGMVVSIVKLDRGGLDPVYTLIVANILISIAGGIILWSYIQTIINTVTESFQGFY